MKDKQLGGNSKDHVLSALQEIDSNAVSSFLGNKYSKDQDSDASWSKVLWAACGI